MITTYRDNAVLKSRLLLNMALIWAGSASIAVVILSALCFYAIKHKQTHWLPVCASSGFDISESDYSPSYIKEMAKKVIMLRLTYNPETVESRFTTLAHLIPADRQESFKKILDLEAKTVKEKNISSVFYEDEIAVDLNKGQVKVKGYLNRTSHGLQIKPKYKQYRLQFSFSNGVMWPESVKEINDEKN